MKKGFTLIELLVIIAIIGLFSILVVVAINNARLKTACEDGDKQACLKLEADKSLTEIQIKKCDDKLIDCRDVCTYSDDNLSECLIKCDIRKETCINDL